MTPALWAVVGAALVAWPLLQLLQIQALKQQVVDLEEQITTLKGTADGAKQIVETERAINDARDLPPDAEFRVLLDILPPTEGTETTGESGPYA